MHHRCWSSRANARVMEVIEGKRKGVRKRMHWSEKVKIIMLPKKPPLMLFFDEQPQPQQQQLVKEHC